jgi:hypothetical protein
MDGTVDGGAWLGLRDAARALGISEKTARRRVKAGQLRGRQVPTRHGPAWEAWVPDRADAAGRVDGGGTQATTMLELVRLVGELQAKAEAAAMWQARADVLALQLEEARAQLALSAPTDAPKSHEDANLTAEAPEPTREPSEPEPTPIPPGPDGRSWWRRWWRALLSTPG